ncbi:MAG: DUF488 domain-containing protein [Natrialbaceae archaeon]|nr:DUF488 domain-containing protein [Natrialbaceae archaeon]
MTTSNRIEDTYVAALRHDLVDFPAEATRIGVVRRPTGWFSAVVDENYPALGPPDSLLDEFKEHHERLKMDGICDEDAHNVAWDEINLEDRYRSHLKESAEAQSAVSDILERLQADEPLVLVCYENTENKRCHRTILKEYLSTQA